MFSSRTHRRRNSFIDAISCADWVLNITLSSPIAPDGARKSCTSYLIVGLYLYSRLLLTDIVRWLGVTSGTRSPLPVMMLSMYLNMLPIRFSGVIIET